MRGIIIGFFGKRRRVERKMKQNNGKRIRLLDFLQKAGPFNGAELSGSKKAAERYIAQLPEEEGIPAKKQQAKLNKLKIQYCVYNY